MQALRDSREFLVHGAVSSSRTQPGELGDAEYFPQKKKSWAVSPFLTALLIVVDCIAKCFVACNHHNVLPHPSLDPMFMCPHSGLCNTHAPRAACALAHRLTSIECRSALGTEQGEHVSNALSKMANAKCTARQKCLHIGTHKQLGSILWRYASPEAVLFSGGRKLLRDHSIPRAHVMIGESFLVSR